MKQEYFDIAKLVLQLVLLVFGIFIAPLFKKWLKLNTTKEQRQNALFWIRNVTKIAEDLYQQKGSGKDKKIFVLEWLNKNGIKLNDEQLSVLVDMVVEEYNKNGWNEM